MGPLRRFILLPLGVIALAGCASNQPASDEPGPNGYIQANPAPPLYVPHPGPDHVGGDPVDQPPS